MLERKWYMPLSTTVLTHVIILAMIATTFSYSRPSEPEFMEVTLSELFSPPEPVADSPAGAPQQPSAPAVSAKPTVTKPAARQSSVQPLIAAGVATDKDIVSVPVTAGNGLVSNIGISNGSGIGEPTGGSGSSSGSGGSGSSGSSGGATHGPRVVASEEPDYPDVARQNNWEGTVKVRVLVSEQGSVEDVLVVASSGYSFLDQSAVTCVLRRWVFSPALNEGKPVAKWVAIPVTFRLK
jgi:protein TonB